MCDKLDKISPSTAPHKHYVAFRYVDPLTESTFEQVKEYVFSNMLFTVVLYFCKKKKKCTIIFRDGAKRIVLFSQYPQYSCATSGSSFNVIYSHFQNK